MLVNPWKKYITIKFENGKNKNVLKDENGNVINENPNKEDMDGLFYYYFNMKPILRLPKERCKRYLLEFIRYFYRKNGRVPMANDFNKNPKYPSFNVYQEIFGSWNNSIREAGLLDKRVRIQPQIYSDGELLECLIKWYDEHDEPPTTEDFRYDQKYPSRKPYNRLGGWQNSLKVLGFDIGSLVRRGIIKTNQQKGKFGIMLVVDYYKDITGMKDLTEEDYHSHHDVISSEGTGDVKTSKFYVDENYWIFGIDNIDVDEIEWFYLLAFNEDFTEFKYAWKIPNNEYFEEDVYKEQIIVNGKYHSKDVKYDIENMKEYEITDMIRPIFEKWLENIKRQYNSTEVIVREARERLRKYIENNEKIRR